MKPKINTAIDRRGIIMWIGVTEETVRRTDHSLSRQKQDDEFRNLFNTWS